MVKQKTFEWSLERGDLLPLLLMLPTLLVILFVMVFPLVYGLLLSFFTIGFGGRLSLDSFVGLDNYLQFFTDPLQRKLRSIPFFSASGPSPVISSWERWSPWDCPSSEEVHLL
jgi:ABC-type sugar transport system permease subunit